VPEWGAAGAPKIGVLPSQHQWIKEGLNPFLVTENVAFEEECSPSNRLSASQISCHLSKFI
jgi:hypothetical protein